MLVKLILARETAVSLSLSLTHLNFGALGVRSFVDERQLSNPRTVDLAALTARLISQLSQRARHSCVSLPLAL